MVILKHISEAFLGHRAKLVVGDSDVEGADTEARSGELSAAGLESGLGAAG
jgi:hypothetical protein